MWVARLPRIDGGRQRRGRSLGRATKAIDSVRSALASTRRRSRSCSLSRRCLHGRLLCGLCFSADTLGQTFSARLAIPLFESLVRELAFDEQLRKLATLRLTLERHEGS